MSSACVLVKEFQCYTPKCLMAGYFIQLKLLIRDGTFLKCGSVCEKMQMLKCIGLVSVV